MSVLEVWKHLEADLCRCCHSQAQNSYKSLYKPFMWMRTERIVLADLLKECFNIQLMSVEEPLNEMVCSICNACIKKLQEAVLFKREVQKCEERFKKMYAEFLNKVTLIATEIKEEIIDDNEDYDNALENDTETAEVIEKNQTTANENKTKHGVGEDSNLWLEIDIETIERNNALRNNGITKDDQKKAKKKPSTDDEDDGLIDPWDEIDFDSISEEAAHKEKEAKASKRTLKKDEESKEDALSKPARNKIICIEGEDYKMVEDEYQCLKCKRTLKNLKNLKSHLRSSHNLRFRCEICTQGFSYFNAVIMHQLKAHNIDRRFKCNACDKSFFGQKLYRNHMDSYHMLGKKIKCKQCDYETYLKESMKKHKLVHTSKKELHCKFCNKSFVRRSTLNFHERIHTGDKRKVCKECKQAFVQKASLNYHMAKHHPEVPF